MEVAAATAAGKAAQADAVRAHNLGVAALKAASDREEARLAVELALARQQAREADSGRMRVEQLCADAEHAREQLQQQLEQSRKQLEVRFLMNGTLARSTLACFPSYDRYPSAHVIDA